VHVGTDSKVRAADIEYKIPGEVRFRSTTRPIHKLVLIISVEEQVIEEDKGEEVIVEPESRNQDKGSDSRAQGKEDDGEAENGSAMSEEQSPLREAAGESEEEIQHEGLDPLTTAKACPAPIGIKFSDEVEEMVDIGAALKRGRGRPKKSKDAIPPLQKGMDPPDPHKGSVTDSGKEVCVDPGEKEAILEAGEPGPPGGGKGGQLASHSGGGET
jgi:hypothetical protein